MSWERKIPFGYMIQNGELLLHPTESIAVQQIFTLYCKGASYNNIVAEMAAQKICYHEGKCFWNKNMVSRILENQKYIGADGYPQIITETEFLSVRLLRQQKTAYIPCPQEIRSIKQKVACAVCGGRMKRDTKSGRPCWQCQTPECGHRVCVQDEDLLDQLEELLQQLAKAPHLLTAPSQDNPPSIDAIRIQNELNLCLSRSGASPEYLKSLIFAAAEERYNSTPDPTPAYQLERLQGRLLQNPESEDVFKELFQNHVSAICIGPDKNIFLQLLNGQVFSPEKGA